MEENDKILVRFIIEMLGSPKEHIEKTMSDFVEKLKKDHEVKAVTIEPAKEQENNFFSTFVELDVYFTKLDELFAFCFDAMPSSVEVIEPETLRIKNHQITDALNELQAKNHELDMHVKNLRSANELIDKNAMNLFRNFVKFFTKESPKTTEEIAEVTGITEKSLKIFLDRLIESNTVSLKEGKYIVENE